ncbi:11119_t:CDS:2, partial [Cetraspora pellucida]
REVTQKLSAFQTFEEFRTCMKAKNRRLKAFFDELHDLALYLDSTGTGDSTINALAELSITSISQTVWRKKKEILESYMDTINNYLEKYHETSMVLNVDDYHNIHTNHVPKGSETLTPTHM